MVKHLGIYCDCGDAAPGGVIASGVGHRASGRCTHTGRGGGVAVIIVCPTPCGCLSWVLGYISSQTIPTATFTALCIS